MIIRKITSADYDNFMEMCIAFYNSNAVSHPVDPLNFTYTFNELMNENPFLCGYIFDYNSVPAGYALLSFTWSNESGGRVVWLEELYIKPDFRGMGFGSEFLAFMLDKYKPSTTRFRLEVSEDNPAAKKLYSRFGFDILSYQQMSLDTH